MFEGKSKLRHAVAERRQEFLEQEAAFVERQDSRLRVDAALLGQLQALHELRVVAVKLLHEQIRLRRVFKLQTNETPCTSGTLFQGCVTSHTTCCLLDEICSSSSCCVELSSSRTLRMSSSCFDCFRSSSSRESAEKKDNLQTKKQI